MRLTRTDLGIAIANAQSVSSSRSRGNYHCSSEFRPLPYYPHRLTNSFRERLSMVTVDWAILSSCLICMTNRSLGSSILFGSLAYSAMQVRSGRLKVCQYLRGCLFSTSLLPELVCVCLLPNHLLCAYYQVAKVKKTSTLLSYEDHRSV